MIQTQQQKKDQNHSTLSETVVVMQQSALSLSWTQDAASESSLDPLGVS